MDLATKLLDEDYDWGDTRIDYDTYDELFADLVINYLKKHGPEMRQKLVLCWNFDNPKRVIQWIVDQPDTDKGTSLLLYWWMEPDFSKDFANRQECENTYAWYLEDYDIIEAIERNYKSGFYKDQCYAFDPCRDFYQGGRDWPAHMDQTKFKTPIPPEMFVALKGAVIAEPSWEDGIPDELLPAIERLNDLLDECQPVQPCL